MNFLEIAKDYKRIMKNYSCPWKDAMFSFCIGKNAFLSIVKSPEFSESANSIND